MAWNFMQIELIPADGLARPMVGPGEFTREQAHGEIQSLLDGLPPFARIADAWRRGAKDDTVYGGPFIWTIYEYPADEDPRIAAHAWLEDFVNTMRKAGAGNVEIAAIPGGWPAP